MVPGFYQPRPSSERGLYLLLPTQEPSLERLKSPAYQTSLLRFIYGFIQHIRIALTPASLLKLVHSTISRAVLTALMSLFRHCITSLILGLRKKTRGDPTTTSSRKKPF